MQQNFRILNEEGEQHLDIEF